MAIYDAQSQNTARATRKYTDLDLFFGKKSSDSDIQKVTDIQAVKRSIRNLVQLNTYEKPFHPEIAGGIRQMLFENMTPTVAIIISKQLEQVIANYEPRARLVTVRTLPQFDRNAYAVTINFQVVNSPTPVVVETLLERLR